MSLGLTQRERKLKIIHGLLMLLAGLFIPIIITIGNYVFIILPYGGETGIILVRADLVITMVWIVSTSWAILMAFMILIDWFPSSYYDSLETCSVCGEDSVKRVDDAMCYSCGANKDEIDEAEMATAP